MRATPLLTVLAAALVACGSDGDDANGFPAADPPATGAGTQPAEEGSAAQTRRRGYRLVPVGRFDSPLFVTAPPGDRDRIFVVEQEGRVIVVRGGRRSTFLDIRSQVTAGGEQG